MPDSLRVLVVMATYNEMENLPALVEKIRETLPDADILVVDDNSPDGTGKWCDQHKSVDARFHVLHRPHKLGLGTATVAGLRFALDQRFDRVATLDADFSHHPRYLPSMLATIDDLVNPADVVIGSRYIAGGGVEGWPRRRRLMSRCLNLYARLLLGLKPRDCSGAYRCFRVSILSQIDWHDVRSPGYSFLEEMLWLLQKAGARIREVPIIFHNRTQGRSKITTREACTTLWLILRLAIQRRRKKPESP